MCSEIHRIKIDFALPVELSDDEYRWFSDIVQRISKRHQPEGMVHWCAGQGSKPNFSQADQRFLGKEIDPDAPLSGEPTWDDTIYVIETCAREAYPEEIERDRKIAEKKVEHERSFRYKAFGVAWKAFNFMGDCISRMEKGRWSSGK